MNILVSIVIPVYNNTDTILETLLSIEAQTYSNIEVIIVDDGSCDHLNVLIENYTPTRPLALTYHHQSNAGASVARNTGAELAQGQYLIFIDADDYIHKNYIEKCVQILQENEVINIVYAGAEFFGAETGKWNLPDFNLLSFLKYNCIPIFAMIRTEVFFNVGKFYQNLSFTEDWELWIRIIKAYGGVYKIPETMYFYRKRLDKTSLTDNMHINNNSDLSRLYIYNKHYDFYSENQLNLTALIDTTIQFQHLRNKYNNIWYKKINSKIKRLGRIK